MAAERVDQLPFSELVDHVIAERSLSLAEVARRVDDAAAAEGQHPETSKQQVHRWRRGPQVPQPSTVRWLATALGQPVEDLAAAAERQRRLLAAHGRGATGSGKALQLVVGQAGPQAYPAEPRPQPGQLDLHASWSALFGAAVRRVRSELRPERPLTEEEFGQLVDAGGAQIGVIERGLAPPDEQFVRACERVFPEAAVLLRAILPFARAEWDRWQQGGMAPPRGTVLSPAELIASPAQAADPAYLESLERELPEALLLGREAESSHIPSGALETVDRVVDRLCRDYPSTPPGLLRAQVEGRLRQIRQYLDGRLTLAQHRQLLVAGGWLTTLLACLQFDLGDAAGAEASRDIAFRLGRDAGHQELVAWSFELLAWFALVEGRFGDTVEYARSGFESAPSTSAGVQLAVQEARGWSRLGERKEAEQAMRRATASLAKLPVPGHPEHHFVFDASKLSFYASTCFTWLGQAEAAEEHAREVVAQCLAVPGEVRWPIRLAETRVDLGLIAARRRQLDEAAHLGRLALASQRKSGSTLERVGELDAALLRRFPEAAEARDFHERYQAAQRALTQGAGA
jgi:tetratricopeptide (TPR) repeat protein